MKKLYILFLFAVPLSNLSAQVTLCFINNSPCPGDTASAREISWVDPGTPGENQVWDFSGARFTGKDNFIDVRDLSSPGMAGRKEKQVIFSQDGYDYRYVAGEGGYSETGCVNSAKMMTLDYSDPVVRMKFPFSYGDRFSDPFAGITWYSGRSRNDVTGIYSVEADAYGTLILPDRILGNVLRVKTVRKSLQTSPCGSTVSNSVKYYWYAPGYRYPVMMTGSAESRYGGREPVITKSAWICSNQGTAGSLTSVTPAAGRDGSMESAVFVYPNPFSDRLVYDYFLREQMPVAVELYDLPGKFMISLEKKQIKSEGLHTGTMNSSLTGVPPGVYYLRFTFDKMVVVRKVVKI